MSTETNIIKPSRLKIEFINLLPIFLGRREVNSCSPSRPAHDRSGDVCAGVVGWADDGRISRNPVDIGRGVAFKEPLIEQLQFVLAGGNQLLELLVLLLQFAVAFLFFFRDRLIRLVVTVTWPVRITNHFHHLGMNKL